MSIDIFSDDPEVITTLQYNKALEYQESFIHGVGCDLIVIGLFQGKPKCIACKNWIANVWREHYSRVDALSKDLDYTTCGAMPYTARELMMEVLGI